MKNSPKRLSTLQLVAATYFMVSGGPFGLEELVQKTGYMVSVIILLITPFVWSMPTALMLGELSSSIPAEGGFYVWVRRALGPFWGFQEAWLSLVASVFDMAIYPTLFVLYLSRLWPVAEKYGVLIGVAMIAACVIWNLRGAQSVGGGSEWMTAMLLVPFGILISYALPHSAKAIGEVAVVGGPDLLGGVMVAMWNYMGWDNASTVAGEVEDPQRTYPLAMFGAVALVTISYVLPVAAMSRTGIDPSGWTTGSWADVGRQLAGEWLAVGIVVAGMVSAFGMFNALILSYSRLPFVLAEDGLLPKAFLKQLENGTPWVAVVGCALAWTASLGLSFERLLLLDILLYGASLVLEFVALVALRIREPDLPRPFRVPGGTFGAVAVGVFPTLLLGAALVRNREEQMGRFSALAIGLCLMALGPIVYVGTNRFRISSGNVAVG